MLAEGTAFWSHLQWVLLSEYLHTMHKCWTQGPALPFVDDDWPSSTPSLSSAKRSSATGSKGSTSNSCRQLLYFGADCPVWGGGSGSSRPTAVTDDVEMLAPKQPSAEFQTRTGTSNAP